MLVTCQDTTVKAEENKTLHGYPKKAFNSQRQV